jgi:polyhydroxyalkanoate synthesis regulator protein
MDEIADLIKNGEEIIVTDNKTGEDITSSILSQLVGRDLSDEGKEVPKEILTGLLRKGGEGLLGSARNYVGLWQRIVNKAGDRIDKMGDLIDKKDEALDLDDDRVEENIPQNDEVQIWLAEQIDARVERSLKKKNLATKQQIYKLNADMKELSAKIDVLQGIYGDLLGSVTKQTRSKKSSR